MGRLPCCEKVGLKKGPWTPEEDQKLLAYIEEHGHGSWRALPVKAGLQRCGKSCRLRWTNYLRPDIKRGKFSLQEEQSIIQLHALLGNRWSAIATHLPKRTDNEIKNYWNTHLKKRLTKMGIDPVTHKPKSDTLSPANGHSKSVSNLSHMAQWESARLEAEARLVRESKLRDPSNSMPLQSQNQLGTSLPLTLLHNKPSTTLTSPCLDVLRTCEEVWPKPTTSNLGVNIDLESPTSTLSFSENTAPIASMGLINGDSAMCDQGDTMEGGKLGWKCFGKPMRTLDARDHRMDDLLGFSMDTMLFDKGAPWLPETSSMKSGSTGGSGFTEMLLGNSDEQNSLDRVGDSDNAEGDSCVEGDDDEEESNDYWNSLLDLVNSSTPASSPPPMI